MDFLLLLLCLAALSQDITIAKGIPEADSPVVDIPGLGQVVGDVGTSSILKRPYYKYKGIRYGLSPSGERRFQPPEPAGGWSGILDAKSFGQKCPQTGIFYTERGYGGVEALEALVEEELIKTGELRPERQQAGDNKDVEDCLFVHIYTPKVDATAKLPVMVFFHGGAFSGGSALVYGAQNFMDKDVVLVVPHYRLGPLGFLSLHTDEIPGNAGLLDQVLALEWVHNYIESFGGDPDLVTIFGESAGAASVSYLMLSPLSQGLFHRVIAQSGSSLADWAIDDTPEFHTLNVASLVDCEGTGTDGGAVDVAKVTTCLQTVDAMKLTQAYQTYKAQQEKLGYSGFGGCSPIVQKAGKKKYIEKHPLEVIESGDYANVPIMFGANKHEGTYVMAIVYTGYMVPNGVEDDTEYLTYEVPDNALKIVHMRDPNYWLVDAMTNMYIQDDVLGNFTKMTPGLIDFFGAIFLKGPAYHNVQLHSKKNDSYFYAFNYRGQNTLWNMIGVSSAPFDGGVCHANDLLMLFNIPTFFLNDEEKQVSQKMVSLWTNFAKYGEPNPEENMVQGVPKWQPYDNEGEYYMRFDKEFEAHQNFKKEFTIAMDEAKENIKG